MKSCRKTKTKFRGAPRFILAFLVAAGMFTSNLVLAQGNAKGGGSGSGGTGQNGGGLIFFSYTLDLFTTNDDGSGLARFTGFDTEFYGPDAEPSRTRLGGKRWFLHRPWSGNYLIALSDDARAVSLNVQPGVEIVSPPQWGVDDSLISFEGVLWDTDPTSATFGQRLAGGLFILDYTTDTDGNVTGVDGPAVLVFEAPLVVDSTDGTVRPDMRDHDWAPDGMQFVFDVISTESLAVGNVLTGQIRVLVDGAADQSGVSTPKWSPAGDKIIFYRRAQGSYPEVAIVNANGLNRKTLVRGAAGYTWTVGAWSPSGSHLLVNYRDHAGRDNYLLRMAADGSGKTRITPKNRWPGNLTQPVVTGWRN